MYNNKKIGVGIVTCNRPESFKRLLEQVLANKDVDYVAVVKNKVFDYGQNDPALDTERKYDYANVVEDAGVGYCKNQCLMAMLEHGCDHLFLIEDDISIKRDDVFSEYVRIAGKFNQGHMNFNQLPMYKDKNAVYKVSNDGDAVAVSFRLCGCFSYFERNALLHCGLIDDRHYVNCLEHAEHAYRFSLQEYCPPFYAFTDIVDSFEYLEDGGSQTTISRDEDIYRQRKARAYYSFVNAYGTPMKDLKKPTRKDVVQYFLGRVKVVYGK